MAPADGSQGSQPEISLPRYTCQRPSCGWSWTPRTPARPKVCPHCKSRNWDKPPKVLVIKDLPPDKQALVEQVLKFFEESDPRLAEQMLKFMRMLVDYGRTRQQG